MLEYAKAADICLTVAAVKNCLQANNCDNDSLIADCISEVKERLSLKACAERFPVSYENGMVITDFFAESTDKIGKYMHKCQEIKLFAATVGFDVDRLVEKYNSISMLKAYITDAVASTAIEKWCELLCSRFAEREAHKGNVLLPRFSIGYGNTNIGIQKNICDVLKTKEKIGLYLTDSMLMLPQKSVTAIIPVITKTEAL